VLPPEADSSIQLLQAGEKPDVSYADIGGADVQKQVPWFPLIDLVHR
jgi:26S proteasome regulatory subunit T3